MNITKKEMVELEKSMPPHLRIHLIDDTINELGKKIKTASTGVLLLSELKRDLENGRPVQITIVDIMEELYGLS